MTRLGRWEVVCLGLLTQVLAGCGESRSAESTTDSVALPALPASGALVEPAPAEVDAAGVRAAYVASRQAEGASSPDHRFAVRDASDKPSARNPEHGFWTELGAGGVRISAADGSFQLSLGPTGVRCGEEWAGFGAGAPRIAGAANRVELARTAGKASVDEWYANGPLGLEQGFTLHASPCAGGAAELSIEMNVEGRTAVASTDGKTVVLAGSGLGAPSLRMQDLYVHDATGRMLPARFEAAPDRIALRFGVEGAVYPIQVDPLVVSQEAKLLTSTTGYGGLLEYFGKSVAVDGTTALIGAESDYVTASAQGSAYVFRQYPSGWQLEGFLVASDAAADDRFGQSVSLSGDTAVVGAHQDDGALTNQGGVYVFTRTGTTWSQQQKLTPSDAAQNDYFGWSVAVTGTTLVAGAYSKTVGANVAQGAAYVFERSGAVWSQQAKLTASDGTTTDYFGGSSSISGTTAVIGAYGGPGVTTTAGAAYVYTRSGVTWTQQTKLTASDGANADQFGWSVSIQGNTAVAGAPFANVGANVDQGAAYVFLRSGTTWSQQQKLAVGAAGDRAGSSVSVDVNTALVGAPRRDGAFADQGNAYVFVRSGVTWSLQSSLSVPFVSGKLPGDLDQFGGAVSVKGDVALVGAVGADYDVVAQGVVAVFTRSAAKWDNGVLLTACDDAEGAGTSVAVLGDTALLGAPTEDIGNNATQGAGYVFARSGVTWTRQARLVASDGAATDQLGTGVALGPDWALLGAGSATVGANADQGAVYSFARSGTTWSQQQKLTASDGVAGDAFGAAVAAAGNDAIIGAPQSDPGGAAARGSAYVFTRSGTTWSQQQKLTASDGVAGDQLGVSVGIDGGTAVAGAPLADVSGNADRGAAYVFSRSGVTWTQQQKLTAADGAANHQFGDSVGVLGNTAAVGAPLASGAMTTTGAAYVFVRSGATWSQQQKLAASDGKINERFGDSLAVVSEGVLVGASARGPGGAAPGAAYVYIRSGVAWAERATLVASDGLNLDHFGSAVAISGDTAVLGAPDDDFDAHSSHGSAYVFRVKGLAGQTCGALDQCDANYFCVDGVCCTSACPGPCEVCSVALGAVANGQCTVKPANSAPDVGCPGGALCNGTSGACPGGCSNDTNCPAGSYCNAAGTCLPWRANGQACNPAADCAAPGCHVCQSNFCVDGFCCDGACNGGPCDRCNSPAGTCSLIPKGGDPQSSCNGYQCNGTAAGCGTTCSAPTDCSAGYFCNAGNCAPKKAQGEDCGAQAECQSGLFCSDGVCCATACQGKCQACKAANKENGTASGVCEAAKKGSNPGGLCVKSSDPCGEQASCSGTDGVCAVAAFATSCGPTTCNGTAVSGKICDGTGTCVDQQNAECSPYVCQAGSCTSPCTQDQQCVSDHYCSGGFCVPKLTNGKGCSATNQCTSSFCVDGVCCDSPCNGQCSACAEIGSVGTCKVVTGAPRAPRIDCTGTGACKGQCDGTNPNACAFPGSATTCQAAKCTGDVSQPAGTCDGTGSCTLPATSNCAPYGCDSVAGTCKTSCAGDTDCSQGATCNTTTGQCTTGAATCLDATTLKLANGQTQSCAPYKCVGGACQQQCSTPSDCATGYVCQGNACVAQDGGTDAGTGGTGGTGGSGGSSSGGSDAGGASTGGSSTGGKKSDSSGDDGGCGCRVPAREQSSGAAWLVALGLAAAMRRRRACGSRGEAA